MCRTCESPQTDNQEYLRQQQLLAKEESVKKQVELNALFQRAVSFPSSCSRCAACIKSCFKDTDMHRIYEDYARHGGRIAITQEECTIILRRVREKCYNNTSTIEAALRATGFSLNL